MAGNGLSPRNALEYFTFGARAKQGLKMKLAFLATSALVLGFAAPALAQDANPDEGKLSGDYLAVGIGAGYGPSYEGSDDYSVFPVPLVQGRLAGIDINPRAGGIALDFVPDPPNGVGVNLGVAAKVRLDRTHNTHDPVVNSLGELDTAVEIGPTAGVSVPHVLNPYDVLTFTTDVLWDVAGAYKGMVVDPMVSYSTPLSRGVLANWSLNAEYGDRKFANYYFSVSPTASAASGLPAFRAGSGFTKVGTRLLIAFDLDGDLTDGGPAIFAIGGYTRMLGDARRSPLTSIRGSPNQFLGAVGVGYTF
jgi:outer membrane scaffolding protein for murein synthesis (MipA/OmpV family)